MVYKGEGKMEDKTKPGFFLSYAVCQNKRDLLCSGNIMTQCIPGNQLGKLVFNK